MLHRSLRHLFGLFALLAVLSGRSAAQPAQPNVLFIAIDDLRPELGCYGVANAVSPNLDRFASEGVLFTRHYAPVPTCGASRYALLTGRCPGRSGVTESNEALYQGKTALLREEQPGAQTLPELFRRSGYRTVCLGKISHTPDGRVFEYDGTGDGRPELPNAWDALPTPFGPWQRGWGAFFAYEGGLHREDGQGHRDLMQLTATRDEELPDGLIAKEAIAQLAALKQAGRPFFLATGFYKPHLPFVATRADWDAVAEAELPPADTRAKPDSDWWPRSGEFYGYTSPFPKTQPLPEDGQRKARRAYRACARYVDRQVGKVLDALRTQGLAENTVVVIWGDHGWHLGEQQVWGKHTPFERSLRSVLMIRAPGVTRSGTRSDALVETTDLYPTLVDLCQPKFTQTRFPLDGKSLRGLMAGQPAPLHEAAVSWWKNSVSVRTTTHRLITTRMPATPERMELYDLSQDPDGMTNIAEREPELARKLIDYGRSRSRND